MENTRFRGLLGSKPSTTRKKYLMKILGINLRINFRMGTWKKEVVRAGRRSKK
jgi:hypothetical protein